MKFFRNLSTVGCLLWFVIIVFSVVGEVKCVIKALRCDWQPIGKAEIIYAGASITGLGSIVGWFDIEDVKKTDEIHE